MRLVAPTVVAIVLLPLEAFAQAPAAAPTPPVAAPPAPASAPAAATTAPAPAAPAPTAPVPSEAGPSTPASANQSLPDTGWELGVRIAFSQPFGDKLSQLLVGAMPLWIDAGRRFSRQLVLGAYASIAELFPVVGTGFALLVGGQGQYHFSEPILGLDPWVGATFGLEWADVSVLGHDQTFSGPGGGVQAGLDYAQGFGPYLGFTVGSFSSGETHEFLTIGLRGTYDW